MNIDSFEEWQRRERDLLQEGEELLRRLERSERECERRDGWTTTEEKALRSRMHGGRICKVIR
jgi:hypothetical protein